MVKKEFNWMILFWISISILFIWLVLKELGYINTPELVRLIPYFTGILALLSFVKEFGELKSEVKGLGIYMKEIKVEIKEIRKELNNHDKRITIIETR